MSCLLTVLRFGRCLETFHSALPVFSSVSNPVVRFTSAMSRISGGCYLLIDHINCLDKLGFIKLKKSTSSRLDRVGSRLWLYAIFLGLMRDIYELLRIYKEVYRTDFKLKIQNSLSTSQDVNGRGSTLLNESSEVEAEVTKTIDTQKQSRFCELQKVVGRLNLFKKFVIEHADVTLDMSKNLCDIFLPLSSLGYVKLSSNFTSLLGVLSTILSVIPMLNPMVKMVPAT